MNRKLIWPGVAAATMVALAGCMQKKPAAAPPAPPKVTVSRPQMALVTNWDEYPGRLEAIEMVELRPRVSGYLQSIHFTDGAEVRADDLLFVIDPKPYEAELNHAKAQREQAETHLEWTRNDLRRAEGLRGSKAISEEEYDSRSKAVREAEAALAAARAAEATAQLNLDYTRITAPVSGKIGRRLVTVGNLVQSSGPATVLATIVSVDPIYCYFDVDESSFRKYQKNKALATAELKASPLPCEMALGNDAGFERRGRLDFFDSQVNPQTGTIRLRAVFNNADRALVPGMFSRLRLPSGPPAQTLVVPDVAVGSDQGYKFVYVVDGSGKVEVRSIETGPAHGAMRTVVKGLKPEDQVVTNGLMMLRAGIQVQVTEAK